MAGAAGGRLASAVHKGGAMGFLAGGHQPVAHLIKEIEIARKDINLSKDELLPIGIGIICWRIESPASTESLANEFLSVISNARPKAIWLSFGKELHRWVLEFRKLDEKIRARDGGRKVIIMVMVGTVEHALEVASWGEVDVLVAQGIESGGHGTALALPLLSLLPTIVKAFSTLKNPPILVGAGGISTGAQILSILPFCDGAVFGTAFLPTPECLYTPEQKELIISKLTDGRSTIRSENFDYCRGTLGFPNGVNGRAVSNKTVEEGKGGSGWNEDLKEKYAEAVKVGDTERIVTWAGTSVGLVTKITGAKELVEEVEKEMLAGFERLNSMRA